MKIDQISYQAGIPEQYRTAAVELFDEAFGKKLSVAVKNRDERIRLFNNGFNLEYAIGAVSGDRLLGLAGIKTANGSLTEDISYWDLLSGLGFIKSTRAAIIFSLYERKPGPGQLMMDGIAVCPEARGKGVGSKLLLELKKYAQQNGYSSIRLDVIDTNPGAKRLYERMGFETVKTESFPYLKWLFGFSGVNTMELKII